MKRSLLVLPLLAATVVFSISVSPLAHAQGKMDKPVKSKSKPQEMMAASGAFPVVKMGDPKVKSALFSSDLVKARKLIGKTVSVVGTVDKVYLPKSNGVVLLNFAKDYKAALVGAVMSKDFGKFPPLTALQGKKIVMTGKLILFKGAPEVQLDKAGAIAMVK